MRRHYTPEFLKSDKDYQIEGKNSLIFRRKSYPLFKPKAQKLSSMQIHAMSLSLVFSRCFKQSGSLGLIQNLSLGWRWDFSLGLEQLVEPGLEIGLEFKLSPKSAQRLLIVFPHIVVFHCGVLFRRFIVAFHLSCTLFVPHFNQHFHYTFTPCSSHFNHTLTTHSAPVLPLLSLAPIPHLCR